MRSVILLRCAFWLCLFGVLVLSLMPPSPEMPTTGWDKTNHLLGFAVPMLLGRWAYRGRTPALVAGLMAFGALVEVLQSLTPYRFAEWADLLADGVGLFCGWVIGEAAAWIASRRDAGGAAK